MQTISLYIEILDSGFILEQQGKRQAVEGYEKLDEIFKQKLDEIITDYLYKANVNHARLEISIEVNPTLNAKVK